MTNIASSQETQKLIAAAATWGRVAEREGYSEFGLVSGNVSGFAQGPDIIEKSALLQRLMGGKEPLIYRPPTSYSYPWYEVIESIQSEHQVFVGDAPSLGSMFSPGANPSEPCISINGALWRIEETICPDQDYIVSWGQYPIRWRLFLKREQNGSIKERLEARENHLLNQCESWMSAVDILPGLKTKDSSGV